MVPPSSKLQVLTVYNNQLTGTIPSTIGNARHLQNFDITNNAIFGTIPPSLGNITELKYAILKFNKLTGGGIHSTQASSKLQVWRGVLASRQDNILAA